MEINRRSETVTRALVVLTAALVAVAAPAGASLAQTIEKSPLGLSEAFVYPICDGTTRHYSVTVPLAHDKAIFSYSSCICRRSVDDLKAELSRIVSRATNNGRIDRARLIDLADNIWDGQIAVELDSSGKGAETVYCYTAEQISALADN